MSSIAPDIWDCDSVRQALARYAELCELYQAAFIVSSWPRQLRYGDGPRAWPARFGLLSSKWDLDMALRRLTPLDQALFHLRYRRGYSQARIGRILGCSRGRVWQLLERMPARVLQALCDTGAADEPRIGRTTAVTGSAASGASSGSGGHRRWHVGVPRPRPERERVGAGHGARRAGGEGGEPARAGTRGATYAELSMWR